MKKKPVTVGGSDFLRGYSCAVATLIRLEGLTPSAEELLLAGFSEKDFPFLEEYDLEVLIPAFKEIREKQAYQEKAYSQAQEVKA